MLPGAQATLTKALNARLDGLAAEHSDKVESNVEDLNQTNITRTRTGPFGGDQGTTTRSVKTHLEDIERDTGRIIRSVREGVGQDCYQHRVAQTDQDADLLDVRIEVAALLMVEGVVSGVEARATEWVQGQLATHAVAIKNTTGATRDAFRRVEEQASAPEPVLVELKLNEKTSTRDGRGDPLPTYVGHLLADDTGRYPAALNEWERTVIETEQARDSFVAWYRNPSRPSPSAVRIAYMDDRERWTPVQVDFVIVSRRDNGSLGTSLLDPHGDQFADARASSSALSDYAERFGDDFVRIESLAVANGALRSLNLLDPNVREASRAFDGAKVTVLHESERATDYQ